MKIRPQGGIQSANTPTYSQPGTVRDDYAIYRCMVTKVLYVDDPNNITKNSQNPEVLYECVILGGHPTGQTLSYCRLASWLGGDSNYSERTLKAATKDFSKTRLSQNDGDIVLIQFIQGHNSYPVIISLLKGISNKIGATKSEGPRLLEEYNGIVRNINNKGELTTTMKGGSTKDGVFTPGTSSMVTETWSSNQKVTRKYKSGLTITEDGKNNKVSINANGTEIEIDGNTGKISLKGSFVDLGKSVSDLVTQFTKLASAFATHKHPYTDDGHPTVTGPPTAPLLSTVGSQTVKVQS